MRNTNTDNEIDRTLRPLVRLTIATFLVLTVVTLSSVYQRFDALEDRLLTLEAELVAARALATSPNAAERVTQPTFTANTAPKAQAALRLSPRAETTLAAAHLDD